MRLYYYLQGEPGESMRAPNVFDFDVPGDSVTLRQLAEVFPLQHTGEFHFRFRAASQEYKFVWTDVSDPDAPLPVVNSSLFSKVLRLGAHCAPALAVLPWPPPYLLAADTVTGRAVRQLRRKPAAAAAPAVAASATGQASPVRQARASVAGSAPLSGSPRVSAPRATSATSAPTAAATSSAASASAAASSTTAAGSAAGTPKADSERVGVKRASKSAAATPTPSAAAATTGGSAAAGEADMLSFTAPSRAPRPSVAATPTRSPVTLSAEALEGKSEYVRAGMVRRAQELEAVQAQRLQELREREQQQATDAEDKRSAEQRLGAVVKEWAEENGTLRNVRALLANLHKVLWEGSGWAPVSIADLVQPARVRRSYLKAMLVVHPDRNTGRPPDQRFLAEQTFEALNAAWSKFEQGS